MFEKISPHFVNAPITFATFVAIKKRPTVFTFFFCKVNFTSEKEKPICFSWNIVVRAEV